MIRDAFKWFPYWNKYWICENKCDFILHFVLYALNILKTEFWVSACVWWKVLCSKTTASRDNIFNIINIIQWYLWLYTTTSSWYLSGDGGGCWLLVLVALSKCDSRSPNVYIVDTTLHCLLDSQVCFVKLPIEYTKFNKRDMIWTCGVHNMY